MTLIIRALLLVGAMIAAVIWWAAQQSHVLAMSIPRGAPGDAVPVLVASGPLPYTADGLRCRPLVVLAAGAYEATRPRT